MTPAAEARRAHLMRRLAILDTAPEPAFDALVSVAQSLFRMASVVISLLDGERQWFKARVGCPVEQTERRRSLCQTVVAGGGGVVWAADTRADPRFADSPMVTGSPAILFYAGAPLVLEGVIVGTLAVLDFEPRPDFGEAERAQLAALAAPVEELLRLRLEAAERKAKEEALDLATRRLSLAEELAGVGQWTLEPDTGKIVWTEQVYRIHGLDPASFDPELDDALAFYEEESRAVVSAHLEHTINTGEGFSFRAQIRRASDGALRTVLARGELRRDGEGGRSILFGVFQDITEQTELLRQVSADRERYRLLTQNATDVIATYDGEGTFTYISPSIEALAGRSAESLIGAKTYEVIHPDDHARIARTFRALVQSGAPSARVEYRVAKPSGDVVWVEAHPTPVRDARGVLTGFQDVVRDVSERRAAETAAREATARAEVALAVASKSEARYRLLADNANDMIATMGLDSTVQFVTPASRRVMGYEPEELVGVKTLALTHPDDVAEVRRFFIQLVAQGPTDETVPYQFRGRHKNGHWMWLEGQPRIEYTQAGEPLYIQDVVRDITARKQMEIELDKARLAAEAAAQAKADFLANMSHELRTPLTGILGYADVLAETSDLPAVSRRHAQLIGQAGRSLLTLVNDVLDLSKIEAGGVELEPRPTDVVELLNAALVLVRPQTEGKGLRLRAVMPTAPLRIDLDDGRLRQIVLNLLSNAIKFTEAGEVCLVLERISAPAGRTGLRIIVRDSGIGIPQDRLAQVFGRFEQADSSTTRRFGGTGLGLAITRALVDRMGGRIAVESEVGRGSTFTVTLEAPLSESRPAPVPLAPVALPQAILPSTAGLRVLLAEDVAVNRDLIALLLARHKVALTAVEDGAQAVRAACAQAFDVILMDMQMPVLDGLEATRMIRASDGPCAQAPIYALTANVMPDEIYKCLAAGMDGHIGKPFTADTLGRALEAGARLRPAA